MEVNHDYIAHRCIVFTSWLGLLRSANDLGRCPNCRGTVGDGLKNNRSSADLGAITNGDVSKDGRAGSDQHILSHLGMAVLALTLAGTAQGNAMEEGATIPDDGSLSDDNAGRMIQHDGFADGCGGVDIHSE
jgi:hypothetical protein